MMFGLGSFNLINEFERASNELNAEQLASSSARLQPYSRYRRCETCHIKQINLTKYHTWAIENTNGCCHSMSYRIKDNN